MKKTLQQFVCSSCGYESAQWYGKCPGCGEWNTFQEFKIQKSKFKKGESSKEEKGIKIFKLSEIKSQSTFRLSSKIDEFDRVLGGGFVGGSVILLAGEPGIGKSTLLLEMTKNLPNVLYVCGEESLEQVKMRAERLGIRKADLLLLSETNVERILDVVGNEKQEVSQEMRTGSEEKNHISHISPLFLIIDSIQTLWSEDFEGYPGSISQVRGCSQKILEYAKKNDVTTILVGHINKEGEIAGPMILSHMVDVVLFLEGERFTDLRLLRGFKNRFGPTDEVGVFRMTEKGMEEVVNPSELFIEKTSESQEAGNVAICAMEGTRPILLEIQALVTQSALAIPRRVVTGVDNNRVLLLCAVLQKTLGLPLYNQDVFVKVAGGFKVTEPAADLGICLAIVSSFKNQPLPSKICAFGEVGLLGEIRKVRGEEKRIKEAKKLGFNQILSFATVKNLREAVKTVGVVKNSKTA